MCRIRNVLAVYSMVARATASCKPRDSSQALYLIGCWKAHHCVKPPIGDTFLSWHWLEELVNLSLGPDNHRGSIYHSVMASAEIIKAPSRKSILR